jgi:hypothetical protein
MTDESATSRYAGRARVGITIEAVGRNPLDDPVHRAEALGDPPAPVARQLTGESVHEPWVVARVATP